MRKRITLLLLAATLVQTIPYASTTIARAGEQQASRRADYSETIAALSEFINEQLTEKGIPAISIALVDNQNIVWQKGFGHGNAKAKTPPGANTVYRVGSVSKLFTDIAVMQLVERGRLNLDEPVTRYIPEFRPRNPFDKAITLRQLMSHRSGLVRETPVGSYFDPAEPTLATTIASLNQTSLVYAPDTRTKYSNAAIATVGYVLERTQKTPFATYLKQAVLDPLNMQSSSFAPTPAIRRNLAKAQMWTLDGRTFDAPTFELGIAPAGSMYATLSDLCKFMSAMFAGGRGANGRLLRRETLEEMWTPETDAQGNRTPYGIGFRISDLQGHRLIGHGGAIYGFATTLSALPDDKLGVVVVATKDVANAVTNRIANFALRAMLAEVEGARLPQLERTSPVHPELAKKLAGRYVKEGDSEKTIELIESAGKLFMFRAETGSHVQLRRPGQALIADTSAQSAGMITSLIVDDLFSFGERMIAGKNQLLIGNDTYTRRAIDKPKPLPEKWRGLIGEYGWDHNILYILEKDGKLWALIEWIEYDPLEEISPNVFKFPNRGLYDGERLIFKRDARGRAVAVEAAGVVFKRRSVGPEEGAAQLRVKPLRPVVQLLKEAITAQPPQERGDFRKPTLTELTKLDPTIKLDVRYATTNNFLGSVFYKEARAFLQRPAAEALVRAHRRLKQMGYGLLIHDGYRPWYVTKVFWDATPEDKKIFVANPANGSRHNRGAAVDLTLYDLKTGSPIEMVGTYDETTDRSYPDYPGGSSLQRWHRRLLRDALEAEGFTVYEAEWWHFDYKDWRSYAIGNVPFDRIENR
jgi:CubicO group peptidase (beta-lactamase class C family)/D-alanyl-D-alanine dipeptidase